MMAFIADLASAAFFETWMAVGVAVILFAGACALGLLVVPPGAARPAVRALAGVPFLFLFTGAIGILVYLVGGTAGIGRGIAVILAILCIVAAILQRRFQELRSSRELALLVGLLALGIVLAFFGWGETADGTIRAMPGSWGDGPLHVLISEAFARRSPTSLLAKLRGAGGPDLSMPAFSGETLREPFGYDFVAAMLRRAGFTVGGAFTLPAGALLASLFAWAGHLAAYLSSLRAQRSNLQEGFTGIASAAPRPRNDGRIAAVIAGILLVSFGGVQWAVMAQHEGVWIPTKFFGFHQPSWDKVEDLGLVWASHLNTFLSQKHLLLASAFLLVLAAMLLQEVRKGQNERAGPATPDAPSGFPPTRPAAAGLAGTRLSDRAGMAPALAQQGLESEGAFPEPASLPPTRVLRTLVGTRVGLAKKARGAGELGPAPSFTLLLPFAIATGLLPFFHVHAFIVAGLLWGVALLLRRSAATFSLAALALLIALPFVLWTSGLFGREGFLSLTPGWMAPGIVRWLWFWAVNLGVYVVVLALALARAWRTDRHLLLFFGLPAGIVFLAANLVQFQPYLWDNFKFFLMAWVLLLPLIAAEIAQWRFGGSRTVVVAVVVFMSLTTLANLPTYFQFRAQYPVYTPAHRQAANVLEQRIPARRTVVFSDADTVHNHPLTLTGRTLYSGYGGWIWTRRYAWEERVDTMSRLRTSPDRFCALARTARITHVVDSTGKDTAVDSVCP